MADQRAVRALALVGPTGAGKTTLMSAMMAAASGHSADKVGDQSPEARARGHSVELNLAGFDFLGDHYAVVDCPAPWNWPPRAMRLWRRWTWPSWSPIRIRPRRRSSSRWSVSSRRLACPGPCS